MVAINFAPPPVQPAGPIGPAQIAYREELAKALLQRSAGLQNIQSPWQGLAQLSDAAFAGYNAKRAADETASNSKLLAEALSGTMNGQNLSPQTLDTVFALDPELGMSIADSQRKRAEAAGAKQRAVEALNAMGLTEEAGAVQSGLLSVEDAGDILQSSWKPKPPIEINGQLVDPDTLEVLGDFRDPNDAADRKYEKDAAGVLRYVDTGEPVFPGEDGAPPSALDFDDISGLRKEIQALPSYKNYAQARPIYDSMFETAGRNSRASDLNLVYGLGKIMDPTSVVREGEMVMVKNTASLPDWLIGTINSLNGGAGLTPETRNAILTEAYGRMQGYESAFNQDAQMYQGIVDRYDVNAADVIPNFGDLSAWTGNAPVTITSDAEYDALPSGTEFVGPDGKKRRKP